MLNNKMISTISRNVLKMNNLYLNRLLYNMTNNNKIEDKNNKIKFELIYDIKNDRLI